MGVISNNEKVYLNELGIDVIDPARHYWFVRTDGGDYFDDFFLGNYVGIQWNEVIVNADSSFEEIESSVREKYKDESRQGYVAKQIYKFAFEFKKAILYLYQTKIPNTSPLVNCSMITCISKMNLQIQNLLTC